MVLVLPHFCSEYSPVCLMTPLGQGQWLDLHCLHGHQRGPGLGRARGGDRHQGPALAGAHLLLLSDKSGVSNFRTEPYLVRPGLTNHDCLAGGDDLLADLLHPLPAVPAQLQVPRPPHHPRPPGDGGRPGSPQPPAVSDQPVSGPPHHGGRHHDPPPLLSQELPRSVLCTVPPPPPPSPSKNQTDISR